MVHAAVFGAVIHAAVVHARHVHTHVLHGGERPGAQSGNFGAHAGARRDRGAGHAGAVDAFANQRVGAIGRRDHDVVGFSDADLQLVDGYRAHILAVGLNDAHRQAWNANIEGRHRRRVDQAETHALPGLEQRGPVVLRTVTVHEIAIGGRRHVGDVGRVHAHTGPFRPLPERLILAGHESRQRLLLAVEVAGLLLELPEDGYGRHGTVVGQHDDMFAVGPDRVGSRRIDDDRAVVAKLLLESGMAVIPVGAVLPDRKLVNEGRARLDAGEGYAGHAIHGRRHQQPMPMDRAVLVEIVDDAKPGDLAFAKADERRRDRSVDADGLADPAVDGHGLARDSQGDIGSGDDGHGRGKAVRERLRPGGKPPAGRQHASGEGAAAQQVAAIDEPFHGHSLR